ncbi:MAG TPA: hypothetical protein VMO88_15490 [Acidimicrobiales bacterium]|nr:hypothetical protein [Acidimicrobiales bacterium]
MRSPAEIIQLRTGPCREAAGVLPAIAAGEYPLGAPSPIGVHVRECLRCQAELSAYRRLLDQLRELRGDLESPPEGALASLLEALASESAAGTRWALRAAYLGGITVATAAAGAAGVLVWMNRRRPGLAKAS